MRIPPALHAIYEDSHPFIVIRKPSQVGVTEFNINLALFSAAGHYAGRGVILYVLPTQEMADRISQTRVTKAINESPTIRRLATPAAGLAKAPANIHRRSVGPGVIYFVGSEQETQYSGIDADIVIADEFDLMNEDSLSLLQSRLRSSRAGRLVVTSTPTVEAFGVSRLYETSDANRYELECPACGIWQTPEFPGSVDWARMCVICHACETALDQWRPGRWIADHPNETTIRGYQLSRLVLPDPPLAAMQMAYLNKVPTTRETFFRQDIGIPWVEEDARLTLADLESCVSDWSLDDSVLQFEKAVMGVDVGKKLHVVIRGFCEGRWYLHKAIICNDFEELDTLIKHLNISCCVVDALPEQRAARAFAARHRGVVFLCLYVRQGTGRQWSYDHGVGYVHTPRTLAIDEMMYRFRSREYALPESFQEAHDGAYVSQLLTPVRIMKTDAFGHPVAVYENVRDDHFAHAEVYATLAMERVGGSQVIFFQADAFGRLSVREPDRPHPDLRMRDNPQGFSRRSFAAMSPQS